jgi:tetratricopeptide (TPR) repeat protein
MNGFVRELVLSDPSLYPAAHQVLTTLKPELEALDDLIRWRLEMPLDHPKSGDDTFHWRFLLAGDDVTPDLEEHVDGFWERRELGKADAAARLLVGAFPKYADGHNLLGLVALERGRAEEAVPHFEKTVEIGRRLFPGRIARSSYWTNLDTRPYMRGLRNLALALARVGRYADALAVAERLEKECGDEVTAMSDRASIYLNLGRWEEARAAALGLRKLNPAEAFIAAFALAEEGKWVEALENFLQGALHHPDAAPVLAGMPPRQPRNYDEQEDLDLARNDLATLKGYRDRQSPAARRFFERVIAHPRVRDLLRELKKVREERHEVHHKGDRKPYERMTEMQTPEFARAKAAELAPGLGLRPK